MTDNDTKLNLFVDSTDINKHKSKSFKVSKQPKISSSVLNTDSITINESFASKYQAEKQREELSNLRDKYGDQDIQAEEDDDSEDATDEDDVGEKLTPAIDAQIMKTIAAIRTRDEKCFNPKFEFFSDTSLLDVKDADGIKALKNPIADKPLRLTDMNRAALLSGNAFGEDIDSDLPSQKTHVQEQEDVRQALKFAANEVETLSDTEEQGDDLFTMLQKSPAEMEKEEDDYKTWFLNNLKQDNQTRTAFEDWIDQKQDIDTNEKFLMEFVLNRGWVDPLDKHNPNSYNVPDDFTNPLSDHEELLDQFEEEAEKFETKYNFRYEELEQKFGAGASYTPLATSMITTHARTQPESVRRKDTHRAEARKSREDRIKSEKEAKQSEISRLKALKKKEIEDMVSKVSYVGGLKDGKNGDDEERKRLEEVMMSQLEDGDFDLEKWDEVMQNVFNDDYYDQTEGKPIFEDESDIDDDDDLPVASLPSIAEDVECHDEDEHAPKTKDQTLKLKSLLEQYDTMNYEDFIASNTIKTRFRYKPVETDDYGLQPDDILNADDELLNEFLSLKKLAPYRQDERYLKWMKKWNKGKKKRLKEFKGKLKRRVVEEESPIDAANEGGEVRHSKKQKKSRDIKTPVVEEPAVKPKKGDLVQVSADRLASYGFSK